MNSFSLHLEMWYKQPVSKTIGDRGTFPISLPRARDWGMYPVYCSSVSANPQTCMAISGHAIFGNDTRLPTIPTHWFCEIRWKCDCAGHILRTNTRAECRHHQLYIYKVEIRFVFVREICPRSCEEWMGCEYVNMDGIPHFFRSRVKE